MNLTGRYSTIYRNIDKIEQSLDNILLYIDFISNRYELPIILMKDNSVMIMFELGGVDYESLSLEERESISLSFKDALEQLGEGFTLGNYFIREKSEIGRLEISDFTPPVIRYLQEKKQKFWDGIGRESFSSRLFCSLKFKKRGLARKNGFFDFENLLSGKPAMEFQRQEILKNIDRLFDGFTTVRSQLGRLKIGFRELDQVSSFEILYQMINHNEPPQYRDDIPLSWQLVHSNIRYDQKNWNIQVIRESIREDLFAGVVFLKYPPRETFPVLMNRFFDLKFPFVISQNFDFINYPKFEKNLLFNNNIATALSRFDKNAQNYLEEASDFQERVKNDKQMAMNWSVCFVIFGQSTEEIKKNAFTVSSMLKELGSFGMDEKNNLLNAYLSTFPGHERFSKRKEIILSSNGGDLFNGYTLDVGDPDPVDYFIDRNQSIFTYNPFTRRENSHHMLITGPTGSGKSFFANKILMSSLVFNPYIYVIDLSRSFMELFEILRSEMGSETSIFSISKTSVDFQLNPFLIADLDKEELDPEQIKFCEGLLKLMIGEKLITDGNRVVIINSLEQFFKQYRSLLRNNRGQAQPPLDVLIPILRQNCLQEEIPNSLEYWTKGNKGNLFNSGLDSLKTSRFCYFDIQDLESNREENLVIIYCIFDKIMRDIRNESKRSVKKFFFMDEAHRYLREKEFSFWIDHLIRIGRHYNLMEGVITQSVNDIISGDDWSKGIVTNLKQAVFFGGQRGVDEAFSRFQMNEHQIEVYKNLKVNRREFLYWSHSGLRRVLSPLTDPFTYWMATTDPVERFWRGVLKQYIFQGDNQKTIEACVEIAGDITDKEEKQKRFREYSSRFVDIREIEKEGYCE